MIGSNTILEQLMKYYSSDYDISSPYQIADTIYDAYAFYHRFHCYDHVFIRNTTTLSMGDVFRFKDQLHSLIEPSLVRGGESSPPRNHMYSYVTGLFISEKRISENIRRLIKHFRYYKGYGFSRQGYCQARIAAFDLENHSFFYSPSAKELIQEYQRILR